MRNTFHHLPRTMNWQLEMLQERVESWPRFSACQMERCPNDKWLQNTKKHFKIEEFPENVKNRKKKY